MFASHIREDHLLPSDPSVIVTIRKLSWLQRQAAQRQSVRTSAREFIELGGAAFTREIKGIIDADPAAVEKARKDPFMTHDQLTVLVSGIVAWTPEEPVNETSIGDLEPEDAEFLARKILALSLPAEAKQGKNEIGSIAS